MDFKVCIELPHLQWTLLPHKLTLYWVDLGIHGTERKFIMSKLSRIRYPILEIIQVYWDDSKMPTYEHLDFNFSFRAFLILG